MGVSTFYTARGVQRSPSQKCVTGYNQCDGLVLQLSRRRVTSFDEMTYYMWLLVVGGALLATGLGLWVYRLAGGSRFLQRDSRWPVSDSLSSQP
jgi:hypothetical protein